MTKMVSIIVVTYNRGRLSTECLNAIRRQNFRDFKVVIVDNGSSDNSLCEVKGFLEGNQSPPPVKLISLKRNSGFAGGNLEGLKHANGEYIALLNNDTEPDERWLGELVVAMDSDPKVGICASKLIVYGTDTIDSAGDAFSTALRGFKKEEGKKNPSYQEGNYTFGACAGAAIYRRRMIEEIGFLDEDFFLIHEDTDLNFRAQLCGWKVLYVPTAIVYHKVRSSIGQMSNTALYYTLRNSELVRMKNVPLAIFVRCFPEFIIGMLMEFIYFAIKHRHLKLYFKAKLDAIRMLPKMLKKRETILRNRKVTNRYLLSVMTPMGQKDFLIAKIKKFLYA